MTKHKKIILTLALTLVLSAVFVCGICVGAGASGTSQQITATLEPGLTVTVDGTAQQFFDANGSRVYPILYNGSTYLPLRAVCEQVAGFTVGWDQATRTASITTRDVDGVDLLDTQRAYYLTKDPSGNNFMTAWHRMTSDNKTTTVNGYTLTHWLSFFGDHPFIPPIPVKASFNIEGKYDTMTFRYYVDHDATLQVLGDNESVLWEKELKGGELYQEATVDLLGTNQLTFLYTLKSKGTTGFVYDVRLK